MRPEHRDQGGAGGGEGRGEVGLSRCKIRMGHGHRPEGALETVLGEAEIS